MDLRLGSNINPSGWFVQNENPGLGVQPFAEHHFLLVPAGQFPNFVGQGRGFDFKPVLELSSGLLFFFTIDKPKSSKVFFKGCQGDGTGDGAMKERQCSNT